MTEQATTISTEATAVIPNEASSNAPTETASVNAAESRFIDKLSPEFKDVKALSNFKDENDLAKSYVNLNSLLGKKVSDWAAEDVKSLHGKLGAPSAADGYVLPEEAGEESAHLKDMFFKAGLSQDQATAFMQEVILKSRANTSELDANQKLMKENWDIELKKEFGAAFDKRNVLAERAMNNLGLTEVLSNAGLNHHPAVKKALSEVGIKLYEEHQFIGADSKDRRGVTPGEAEAAISKLKQDQGKAIIDRFHPDHKKVNAELREMYDLLGK